ncbi:hypothetical protein PAEPH01_0643 [Pancytospora epiphaga]|nr:hypothetical protein PAEPH01_0643 [Pancytospora epiphaga]
MLNNLIGCGLIYIVLYLDTTLGSYNTSTLSNLKRGLKRKSEENNSTVCKANQYICDITAPCKHFQKNVSEIMVNKVYINSEEDERKLVIDEEITEKIEDETNFVTSNPQSHNSTSYHLENKEVNLVNSQAKIIKEETLGKLNKVNTVLDSNENSWKILLMTTGQKKIRCHYKKLMQGQLDVASVYSYSNSMFLDEFLHSPSPIFTADSIRVRFGSGFLNFLSTNQLTGVLMILLSRDLELTKAERSELVEMIFGCIDFSLNMRFNDNQIASIVTALLLTDVPHCFEQVFLTWKMWKVFTTEEQEKMLEGVINQIDKMKYDKETLVMLYLFVLNRDAINSNVCKVFKEHIIKTYGRSHTFHTLKNDKYLDPIEYIKKSW